LRESIPEYVVGDRIRFELFFARKTKREVP